MKSFAKLVFYCAVVMISAEPASAAQYGASDVGSACKTSGGSCGTVVKDNTMGSVTYVCKKGGKACDMAKAITPVKPDLQSGEAATTPLQSVPQPAN
ncbi:MAG: hypothetical protein JNL61_05710 [Rhizobiaceae bacterium]|nr:hypothetical protein [Rhizobiaceae bacterium]